MYKNEKRRGFQSAFTLIELTMVFAIIAVTSSIVLVNLSNRRTEQDLLRASHELAAAIREAQNYALTGKVTPLKERNCAYYVQFDPAPRTTYSLKKRTVNTSGNCAFNFSTDVSVLETKTFGGGVAFAPYPDASPEAGAGFKLPRGEALRYSGISWDPFGPDPILITLTKSSVNYYLCFYPSGRVEERYTDSNCPS